MPTPSRKHPDSIRLQGSTLAYDHLDARAWSIDLGSVRVIGEYTTAHGPWADDYFIVFVTADARLFEASYYSNGLSECHAQLQRQLGALLPLDLTRSTAWRTRILWPPPAVGRPFLVLKPLQPRGFWSRLRAWLGHPPTEAVLSPEAIAALSPAAGSA